MVFRKILLVFCFLSMNSLYAESQPSGYTLIEDKAKLPLLNPALAKQKQLKIRLPNGLEAYLVSDPELHESAAVLTVQVGSWDEPLESPGMAHFLEHLLFLGTKKYPDENEYTRYLSEHGGMANAFTANGYTSYMFSVQNEGFNGALDRFSRFFYEPMFNVSGINRELNAIDQEYAQNLQKDEVREIYVLKDLSKPQHPNKFFNMGNSASLAKVTRENLINWYRQNYSANIMRLVVVSALPLDTLRDLVVQDFSPIPDTHKTLTKLAERSLPEDILGHFVYIEPIKDIHRLTLAWELPLDLSEMRDAAPETIVCHFLGDEGPHSLLAALKKEKLAENLECGAFEMGPGDILFNLEIDLTHEGITHIDTVLERLFQAIADFRSRSDIAYAYDEMKRMQTIQYQYQSREDLFNSMMKHASWIAYEPLDLYPENARILQRWDPEAVQKIFQLLTPERAIYLVTAPSALTGVPATQTEPWLNVPYGVKAIPADTLTKWAHIGTNPDIQIPEPNPFIPKHLKLITAYSPESKDLYPIPQPIYDSPQGRIYYAPNTTYGVPQAFIELHFKTPLIQSGDAVSVVLADLAVELIEDALNPYSYPATIAGLHFSIDREDNGLGVKVYGYSENSSILLADILEYFHNFVPTESLFAQKKAQLLRSYQNKDKEGPLKQAAEFFKEIVYERYTSPQQRLQALRHIGFNDFQEFFAHLFDTVYVQGLLYGNLTVDDAKKIGQGVMENFSAAPYPLDKQYQVAVMVLPDTGPFYWEELVRVRGNAALLAIEYIDFSFKARAAQEILMQAMGDAFFAALRTRQQTAYLVTTRGEELERQLFNVFAVQSNSHDVRDLLARFELFIEGFLQELEIEEIPQDRFEKIRGSLLNTLEQPPRNIPEMGAMLNRFMEHYDEDFQWMNKRIEGMRSLTYDEFVRFAHDFVGRHNKRRLAILLKGELPDEKLFTYQLVENPDELRSISRFKTHEKAQ